MRTSRWLLALAAFACRPEHGTLVGDQAPPYGATSLAGDSVSTTALAGKVVLLNVWAN